MGASIAWNHDSDLMTLGTNNAGASLAFNSANGSEAVRIDSSGNVGIGTTAPSDLLHIQAGARGVSANNANSHLIMENSGASGASFFGEFISSNNLDAGFIWNDGSLAAWLVYCHTLDKFEFAPSACPSVTMMGTGLVGIGSTTPCEKLEVYNGDLAIKCYASGGTTIGGTIVFIAVSYTHLTLPTKA